MSELEPVRTTNPRTGSFLDRGSLRNITQTEIYFSLFPFFFLIFLLSEVTTIFTANVQHPLASLSVRISGKNC